MSFYCQILSAKAKLSLDLLCREQSMCHAWDQGLEIRAPRKSRDLCSYITSLCGWANYSVKSWKLMSWTTKLDWNVWKREPVVFSVTHQWRLLKYFKAWHKGTVSHTTWLFTPECQQVTETSELSKKRKIKHIMVARNRKYINYSIHQIRCLLCWLL